MEGFQNLKKKTTVFFQLNTKSYKWNSPTYKISWYNKGMAYPFITVVITFYQFATHCKQKWRHTVVITRRNCTLLFFFSMMKVIDC